MVGFFVSSILTSAVLARLLTLVGAFISDGPANVARGGRILTDSRGLIWREHHINIPIIEQVRGGKTNINAMRGYSANFLSIFLPVIIICCSDKVVGGTYEPPILIKGGRWSILSQI